MNRVLFKSMTDEWKTPKWWAVFYFNGKSIMWGLTNRQIGDTYGQSNAWQYAYAHA